MADLPTRAGDVLILKPDQTFHSWAVGRVSRTGQRDFQGLANVQLLDTRAAAMMVGTALLGPGCRLFIRDTDTDQWEQIPTR